MNRDLSSSYCVPDNQDGVTILGANGRPLNTDIQAPELRLVGEPQTLVGSDGRPLGNAIYIPPRNSIVRGLGSDAVERFGNSGEDLALPDGRRQLIIDININPFRTAASVFTERRIFDNPRDMSEREEAISDYIGELLEKRTSILETLSRNNRDDWGVTPPLKIISWVQRVVPEDRIRFEQSDYDRVERIKAGGYLSDSFKVATNGPIERVAEAAVRYVISEPLFRETPVSTLVLDTIEQLIQESRFQKWNNNQSLNEIDPLPFRGLAEECFKALGSEEYSLNRENRLKIYSILSHLDLSPEKAAEVLTVQSNQKTRLGPGEYETDLSHPTAFHFLCVLRKGGSESESAFLQTQSKIREELLSILSREGNQPLFERFDELSTLASKLVYSGSGAKHDRLYGRNIGLEFEYDERRDSSGSNKLAPPGWNISYDIAGAREICVGREHISYDTRWEERLKDATQFIRYEARNHLSDPHDGYAVLSSHYHVDREGSNIDSIRSCFGPFFHDPARGSPIRENPWHPTWELRGCVVPDVSGAPHPARVTDVARLAVSVASASSNSEHPRLILRDDHNPSYPQMIWGHFLRSTGESEARLSALCALRDPRIFAVFNPRKISESFDPSSYTKLFKGMGEHVFRLQERSLHEKFLFALRESSVPLEPFESELTGLLGSDFWRVRLLSIELLASDSSIASRHTFDFMIALADRDGDVRDAASSALGADSLSQIPIESYEAELVSLLVSDSGEMRRRAIHLLALDESVARRHTADFVAGLRDPDELVKDAALLRLEELSVPIVSYEAELVGLLVSDSSEVRRRAIHLLASDDSVLRRHVVDFVKALGDENGYVVDEAVEALNALSASIELRSSDEVGLVGLLGNDHWRVRETAICCLASDESVARRHIVHFVKALGDHDNDVRISASSALEALSVPIESYESDLVGLLDNDDWRIRDDAIRLLASDKSVASRHKVEFFKALEDPESDVRKSALFVIEDLSLPVGSYESELVKLLVNNPWQVRERSIKLLASDNSVARRHLVDFVKALGDVDEDVRKAALKALVKSTPVIGPVFVKMKGWLGRSR